jgi:NADH-quinone oxidoreductase subunit G
MPAGAAAADSGLANSRHQPTRAAPPQNASIDALRLGTYRPIWAAPEVEISPALKFAIARQQVELSPRDAQRLGISNGETVDVAQNGTRLRATAHVRTGVPIGTAFLADGVANDSANALTESLIEVSKAAG